MSARRSTGATCAYVLGLALLAACGGGADATTGGGADGQSGDGTDGGGGAGNGSGNGSGAGEGDGGGGALADAGKGSGGSDSGGGGSGGGDGGGIEGGGALTDSGGLVDGGDVTGAALRSCDSMFEVTPTLPTGYNWNLGALIPGPLLLSRDRAQVFLEGSQLWTIASHGSASTQNVPAQLSGASGFGAWRAVSGMWGATFTVSSKVKASTYDGTTFGAPLDTPCTNSAGSCEARPAGDGHLWLYNGGNLFEQNGATWENRGGPPVTPSLWDVNTAGTVIVLGHDPLQNTSILEVWTLAKNAGGWSKTGALKSADVAAANAAIEGGFQLGAKGPGALAPDGSIHLWSDARCIGTGQRNKTQVHVRSKDGGATWDVQTITSADTLTGNLMSWSDSAFFAGSYENVRWVMVASPTPTYDGFAYTYPNRTYEVIARCTDKNGAPTYARIASESLPGWTSPSYAGFSERGVATLLTSVGVSQVY